jgi:hypothetical protein
MRYTMCADIGVDGELCGKDGNNDENIHRDLVVLS